MWFKKKSVLQAEHHYDTEKSADGTTDLRTTTTWNSYSNSNSSIYDSGLPSAADAGNYFYLPVLGYYFLGKLSGVGGQGNYWSSSADPVGGYRAYNLYFNDHGVRVESFDRISGYRVGAFK